MVEYRDATTHSLEELATGISRCFEDYVVPIAMSPAVLSYLIRVDAVDLANSLVALDDGEIVGILLVCRREATMRVGAMAVAKVCRGRGVGGELLKRALAQAAERGERRAVLEVIDKNTGARKLYERNGFETETRLISGSIVLASDSEAGRPREIGLSEMAAHPSFRDPAVAAWQMSAASLSQMAQPVTAYALDGLAIALAQRGDDRLVCHSMALSGDGDADKLKEMLSALGTICPGGSLHAPPYFPEQAFKGVFGAVGMDIHGLSQWQMARVLA